MVSAVVLTATGVNADGHREVLGLRVATTESSAAWNGLLADLVARGLTGVRLVTSDAHTGLVEAVEHLEAARADLLAYRRLPCRGMETDLVQQPPRTPQQRDPSPHRLSRDLPQQGRHYPPGWRRPSRADR